VFLLNHSVDSSYKYLVLSRLLAQWWLLFFKNMKFCGGIGKRKESLTTYESVYCVYYLLLSFCHLYIYEIHEAFRINTGNQLIFVMEIAVVYFGRRKNYKNSHFRG